MRRVGQPIRERRVPQYLIFDIENIIMRLEYPYKQYQLACIDSSVAKTGELYKFRGSGCLGNEIMLRCANVVPRA